MAGIRLILFYRFATADPLFLLLLQKKKWQKENEPGGISISLRTSLNRPRKPLRFSWIFPAKFDGYAPRISFPCIPCLSLWERCLSEARTERVNRDRQDPLSRLRRQLSQRESQARGLPCLSLWERWLSEAKTERVNRDCQDPLSRLRRQLSQRESQVGAVGDITENAHKTRPTVRAGVRGAAPAR